MSRSGVGLAAECIPAFEELKLGKKTKYIIYKLGDGNKSINVEKTSDDGDYDNFLAQFPENDCRYAVYDFEYSLGGGEGQRSKICFYTWSPDNAPVKAKMIYSSSKDALRRALAGIHAEIQGTDFSEVAHETVLEKVSKGAGNR
ncbi:Cof1 cofilin [Tricharina praecox]|uniref:Cof1 cofilin n=1 Tax=Tricharina praecox TaxID=43433 RepID=UPI0022209EF0|nr:Cof1 cofilin [Tricharina praecox]KAI5858658.1 Cof1 cofilin [Tricharina praecox]